MYEEEPFCLKNGEFSITCPTDHKIIIKEALHKVVKTGPCPTDLSSIDECKVSNLTKDVSEKCQSKKNCIVPVSDTSTACTGYTGKEFVTVSYKCEPGRHSSFRQVTGWHPTDQLPLFALYCHKIEEQFVNALMEV